MTQQTAVHDPNELDLNYNPFLTPPIARELKISADGWHLFENQSTLWPVYLRWNSSKQTDAPIIIQPGAWRLIWLNNEERAWFTPAQPGQTVMISFYGNHKPDLSNQGLFSSAVIPPGTPGSEAKPITTHPEQYITRDMVKYILKRSGPLPPVYLTDAEIDILFNKDCDEHLDLDTWPWIYEIGFKMPMMIKEFEITDPNRMCISTFYRYITPDWKTIPDDFEGQPQYVEKYILPMDSQVSVIQFYFSGPI